MLALRQPLNGGSDDQAVGTVLCLDGSDRLTDALITDAVHRDRDVVCHGGSRPQQKAAQRKQGDQSMHVVLVDFNHSEVACAWLWTLSDGDASLPQRLKRAFVLRLNTTLSLTSPENGFDGFTIGHANC